MSTQQQHQDIDRKSLLRKRLCSKALPLAVYLPFVGDGDLAVAHYSGHRVFAADIDPARVKTAQRRLPSSDVRVADCGEWPFSEVVEPFAIADFDAYANPYPAFVSFWTHAVKADRVVLFGTDGMRYRIKRAHVVRTLPYGEETKVADQSWRKQYNFWWTKHVLPFIAQTVRPYRITAKSSYLRGSIGMLYWGVVVEK